MVTYVNKQSATPPFIVLLAMDVKVQTGNYAHSPVGPSIMLKEQQKNVYSPAAEKVSTKAKLPPLPLEAASDAHPQNAILKHAKDEVQSIMKLLLVEVKQSFENYILCKESRLHFHYCTLLILKTT